MHKRSGESAVCRILPFLVLVPLPSSSRISRRSTFRQPRGKSLSVIKKSSNDGHVCVFSADAHVSNSTTRAASFYRNLRESNGINVPFNSRIDNLTRGRLSERIRRSVGVFLRNFLRMPLQSILVQINKFNKLHLRVTDRGHDNVTFSLDFRRLQRSSDVPETVGAFRERHGGHEPATFAEESLRYERGCPFDSRLSTSLEGVDARV